MKGESRQKHSQSSDPHQLELKSKHDLTDQVFQDMLKMLTELTPAELATLKDPDFITEDEADLIICDRRDIEQMGQPLIPLAEILREIRHFAP